MAKFYRCDHCGIIVGIVQDGGGTLICCGEPMRALEANTTDAAQEKHVPVVEINGNLVTVSVGSVMHPMMDEHHIAWIALGIAVATVLAFGPDNNPQVHYSEEEYRKLRQRMHTALLAYFLLCSILIYLLPNWAHSLIMALLADAFLLIFARVVRCIQRRFVP